MEILDHSNISTEKIKEQIEHFIEEKSTKREYDWLEFKKNLGDLKPNQTAAFLNDKGACIVIGVDEKERSLIHVPSDGANRNNIANKIVKDLKKHENTEIFDFIFNSIRVEELEVNGTPLRLIRLSPLLKNYVALDGKIYKGRSKDGEEPYLLKNEDEITKFVIKKTVANYEIEEFIGVLDKLIELGAIYLNIWNSIAQNKNQKDVLEMIKGKFRKSWISLKLYKEKEKSIRCLFFNHECKQNANKIDVCLNSLNQIIPVPPVNNEEASRVFGNIKQINSNEHYQICNDLGSSAKELKVYLNKLV